MALPPGTRLGPYEILAPLGAGGMGEVYRAKDTRLGREVAVKVLPEHLSKNTEIRQRFEREAKAVSSLNHPHICTLFDIGSHEGTDFLVMELLEGETLGVRLKKGRLDPAEAIRIGIQIAEALERAHRAGFVHRDLKPGNVMITKRGAKLLDFGLARSLSAAVGSGGSSGAGSGPASASPTMAQILTAPPTADSPLTSEGAILGTFQYMAPEQLEGRETDQRTDIFAFGLVLYEMLTGRRAFEAGSQASLIAEILKGEPPKVSEIVETSPPEIDRVIRTCLRKDPDDRFQSAHDVRLQLEWIAEAPAKGEGSADEPVAAAARRPGHRMHPWFVAAVATVVAIAGWVSFGVSRGKAVSTRQMVALPVDTEAGRNNDDFAMSPDGRRLVYVRETPGGQGSLQVREMDSLDARSLEGTEGAEMPFWSPDGRYLGFFSQGKLKKIAADGDSSSQILCDWEGGHGGTWSAEGVILFGGRLSGGGIMKVSADGGTPEEITKVTAQAGGAAGYFESARHEWPVFLPDGRRFLFLRFSGRTQGRGILMGSLDGGEPRKINDSGFKPGFFLPNWLVFMRGPSLMTQRLDLDSLQLLGGPSVVRDGVAEASLPGTAAFSVSLRGDFAYRLAGKARVTKLEWLSRTGTVEGSIGEVASHISVSLSPDGRTASIAKTTGLTLPANGVGEIPVDIWTIDLGRGISTRFTSRPDSSDENPVWSPDGKRIAYASHQNGIAAVYVRDARAAGEESLLCSSEENPHPIDWSPDGRYLLLMVANVLGDADLAYLDLDHPEAAPTLWVGGPGNQSQGQFSPDGKWIAYTSGESGEKEVFVRPFPHGDERWQISAAGGSQPRWRDDGGELYYVAPEGALMAVEIGAGPGFHASAPAKLFDADILDPASFFYGDQAQYDVAPGGRRFLANVEVEPREKSTTIDVILNW
ncbi:MAG TPA: protein kinase, partial [Candidatus Saccharimonadales bacterium]|nr:protein kinase [Candidatus Saccharimonadales bacterium]